MYDVLEIKRKNKNEFLILVKNEIVGCSLWLVAKYKDNTLFYDWKDDFSDFKNKDDFIKMLIQNNSDEFIDATGSANCCLEAEHYIDIDEDFNIELLEEVVD